MSKEKSVVDFVLDIYNANQPAIQTRLATSWQNAIASDNPVNAVYLLFRLEGYDITLGECVKIVESYNNLKDSPPWEQQSGGPVTY